MTSGKSERPEIYITSKPAITGFTPQILAVILLRTSGIFIFARSLPWLVEAMWLWDTYQQSAEEASIYSGNEPLFPVSLKVLTPVVAYALAGLGLWVCATPLARLMVGTRIKDPNDSEATVGHPDPEAFSIRNTVISAEDWRIIGYSIVGAAMTAWAAGWWFSILPNVIQAYREEDRVGQYFQGQLFGATALLVMGQLLMFGTRPITRAWHRARSFR